MDSKRFENVPFHLPVFKRVHSTVAQTRLDIGISFKCFSCIRRVLGPREEYRVKKKKDVRTLRGLIVGRYFDLFIFPRSRGLGGGGGVGHRYTNKDVWRVQGHRNTKTKPTRLGTASRPPAQTGLKLDFARYNDVTINRARPPV